MRDIFSYPSADRNSVLLRFRERRVWVFIFLWFQCGHLFSGTERRILGIPRSFEFPSVSKDWDAPPQFIGGEFPEYPKSLLNPKSGYATVEFIVGKDGKTKDVAAVESDVWEFTFPAVAAVKGWVFKPVMKNNVPVEIHGRIKLLFYSHPNSVPDPIQY